MMPLVTTETSPTTDTSVLSARDLSVSFSTPSGPLEVVRSASFELGRSEAVALVGESGSGKTVTSMAVMGLLPSLGGQLTGGEVRLGGQDVTNLDERSWQDLRGRRISMVFQQPGRALNPAFTVGDQIAEVVRRHTKASRNEAWQAAVEMLDRVQIPSASARAHDYPHEFSGGMAQRVLIAMALVCEPEVVIADEPTTALDVTVQAKILELLRELMDETGVAVLYITHDLGVVAEMCERMVVMYAGEVVETGSCVDLFTRPEHPYTEGLIRSLPQETRGADRFVPIEGQVPPPHLFPRGCRFHPRCPYAEDRCTQGQPELVVSQNGTTRCIRHDELSLRGMTR